ncbi:MAG: hypothetical protein H0T89_21135 [Deltaproteobacteria bacterium]|nr:hypothetical protein [Deltaproteobacteria bacterium]MDQ3298319.1 cytochrome c family protein [Myxococcota bacterium]
MNPRLLIVLAAACGVPTTSAPAPVREAAPSWQARPAGGTQPIDPGVAVTDPLLDARGCASCHAAIVDEWSRSRHALAWTNGIFQREYAARPQPWCVNCHAPLTTQQAAIEGAHAAQGVDCATCHLRAGKLVSKHRRPGSPHDSVGDASFGSPAYCADCHQFTFPVLSPEGVALAMTRHPMQTTVASFAAGPYAGERDGCLSCHGSKHGHAFPGAHDRGMREAALEITWCRKPDALGTGDATLAIAVRNVAAGHTVPSGDIHRHMYLRVWRSSAPEALFQAYFGRRFEPASDGGKRTIWDSTIAPGEAKTFAVPAASLGGDAEEPVQLELIYVFIESEFPRPRRRSAGILEESSRVSIARREATVGELAACAAE